MTDNKTVVEAEVTSGQARCSHAIWKEDLEALRSCYADDVRVFDLGAQFTGCDQLSALWGSCFPYFANPIGTERKDIQLTVNPDMAVATFLSRLTGMESDHPSAKSWLRTTVCLRKLVDGWKIIHDHISLPVDCSAEKPPYILDQPEASSAGRLSS